MTTTDNKIYFWDCEYTTDDCGVNCIINPDDESDIFPCEPYCLNCGHAECECDNYKAGRWFSEEQGAWVAAPIIAAAPAPAEEDIVFNCPDCGTAIIRNSSEHEDCWTDVEIDDGIWYCGYCKCDHMENDDDFDEGDEENCGCCCEPLGEDEHIFIFTKGDEDMKMCRVCGDDTHEKSFRLWMKADGWIRDDEEEKDELCAAIDASGNALF